MLKKRKKKNNIYIVLIFFVSILYIETFNFTSSRYIGQLESDNDVIAIPILTLSNNGVNYTVDNMYPGDTREFEFSVSNKDAEKINEVLLSYTFQITSDSIIPFTFEIYDENDMKIDMANNKTSEETLPYGTELIRNYKLKIIWDANNNDISYAGQVTKVQVELKAVQVI